MSNAAPNTASPDDLTSEAVQERWTKDALLHGHSEADASRQPPVAERRLRELEINLPQPPQPFGAYVASVRTGNLLFLTGMLPTEGRTAKYVGRVGADCDIETAREAAGLAARNALALVRHHLGSLDKVTRVVRLSVSIATSDDFQKHPTVADGASELLEAVFGRARNPCRLVTGVTSLPFGVPVLLELIFEVET